MLGARGREATGRFLLPRFLRLRFLLITHPVPQSLVVLKFLGFRLLYTAAVLVIVSMLVFVVTELLPGNVATMILGMDATPEDVARLEKQLGLNDPQTQRYLRWAGGVARGDFGESLRMQRPIGPILAERLRNSLVLAGVAFLMVGVGGLVLGVFTALREGTKTDRAVSAVSVVGTSMPEFVTAPVLILVFAGAFRESAIARRRRRSRCS